MCGVGRAEKRTANLQAELCGRRADDPVLLKRTVTDTTNEVESRAALHADRAAELAGVVVAHGQVFKRQFVARAASLQLDAATLRAIRAVNVGRADDVIVGDNRAAAVARVTERRRAVGDDDA